jgi:hypothetical protein
MHYHTKVFFTENVFSQALCNNPVFPMKLPFTSVWLDALSKSPDLQGHKLKDDTCLKLPCALHHGQNF